MKLLVTSEEIAKEVARLIPLCKSFEIAVAWASIGFDGFDLLVRHREKIKRLIVGTEFYQTHPQFLKTFHKQPEVRFLLKTDGVFHPKAYWFELPGGHWECLIGSPNFTSGGFGLNCEVAVLISDADQGAETALERFRSAIDEYWAHASTLSESELEAYADAWKLKQPTIKRLKGQFGDPTTASDDRGKPPLETPILRMPWQEFLTRVRSERVTEYGHTVEKRVELIAAARQLFQGSSRFNELDRDARQKIAGTCGVRDGIDWRFFGSMIGAGKFKNAINENRDEVSLALDAIPASGQVARDDYVRFVSQYLRAFPNGGGGTATATRLLAMKRPDVFVCLDQYNKTKLCEAFEIPFSVGFERYWDSIIERVMESRWWLSEEPPSNADQVDRVVWSARAAFLDSLFYDPGNARSLEFCQSFHIVLPDRAEVIPYRETLADGAFAFHVIDQGPSDDDALSVADEDELRQYVVDLGCRVCCKQRDGLRRDFYSPLPPNQVRDASGA